MCTGDLGLGLSASLGFRLVLGCCAGVRIRMGVRVRLV